MATQDKTIPIRFLDFSTLFFNLVTATLTETIQGGNKNILISKPKSSIVQDYKKVTTWSDFRIFVPVLFNLFHGIELWLKGAHYLKEEPQSNSNHKLSYWLNLFKIDYPSQTSVYNILLDYIEPTNNCPILKAFYKTNNINNSDQFFEIFKYPYDKKHNTSFDYKDIRNLGDGGIGFFKKIIMDIEAINAQSPNL